MGRPKKNKIIIKDKLLHHLQNYAYRKGKFTLASGKQSDFYIDCKQTILTPNGMYLVASKMYSIIRPTGVEAIAGEGVGGAPLATGVAMYAHMYQGYDLHTIVVRKATKDHGTTRRIERSKLIANKSPVILLEDVLTTGNSAMAAVRALQADNLDVILVVALVDRNEGAEELFYNEKIDMISIYNRSDFVSN